MALDQNVTSPASAPEPETARGPAIENELPAYRAISPLAVVGLLCGVLSILSFTSWFFLGFAVLAIVLGVMAERKIRRDPEIWTGRGFAQAGTALGLVFGLSAVTVTLVQGYLDRKAATVFAKQYIGILKEGTEAEAIYYQLNPFQREGQKPEEVYKELKAQPEPSSLESRYGPTLKIKKRLASSPQEDIHFVKIEQTGAEEMATFAAALVELHGPGSKEFPAKVEFAMLLLKGISNKGKFQWWVDQVAFPYEPASYTPAAKPVDDGHGHAH